MTTQLSRNHYFQQMEIIVKFLLPTKKSLHIYVYTHMYTHTHIYVYTHVYMLYVHTHICIYYCLGKMKN